MKFKVNTPNASRRAWAAEKVNAIRGQRPAQFDVKYEQKKARRKMARASRRGNR